MAWTQADLDALEAVIAQGALEVQFQDRRVRYQSRADLMMARDTIKKALGQTSKDGKRKYFTHSKGM